MSLESSKGEIILVSETSAKYICNVEHTIEEAWLEEFSGDELQDIAWECDEKLVELETVMRKCKD
jgi:hypothetical protein